MASYTHWPAHGLTPPEHWLCYWPNEVQGHNFKTESWGHALCSASDGTDAHREKAAIGVSGRGFEDAAGHPGEGTGVHPQPSGWDHSISGFSKRSLFAGVGQWVTPNSECIWGQEIKLININSFSGGIKKNTNLWSETKPKVKTGKRKCLRYSFYMLGTRDLTWITSYEVSFLTCYQEVVRAVRHLHEEDSTWQGRESSWQEPRV